MADEQTSTPETSDVPMIIKRDPSALPEVFQLEELEQLRLAANNEKLRRMGAELQMAQMQMVQLKGHAEQLQQDYQKAGETQGEMLLAIGASHGIPGPAIRRYDINVQTGECALRKQPPQPPKG